jgi:hypothetical protein
MKIFKALLLTAFVLMCSTANAEGFLGTFPGNDLPSVVESILGIDATLLGKVESIPGADNGFVVTASLFTPDGFAAGTWFYPGPEKVNIITLKAGARWAAWCVNDPCAPVDFSSFSSGGVWDTAELDWKGASHISAWSVDCAHAPEPSTLTMVILLGCVGVMWYLGGRE